MKGKNLKKRTTKGPLKKMTYIKSLVLDDWHHICVEEEIGRQPFSLIGKI